MGGTKVSGAGITGVSKPVLLPIKWERSVGADSPGSAGDGAAFSFDAGVSGVFIIQLG